MSESRYERVKQILLQARQLSGVARNTYLDEACGEDAELRSEVESFLPHDTSAPEILEDGALSDRIEETLSKAPSGVVPPPMPDRIGPYEILGVLGEGGMGVVYDAEQRHPIRRSVALKLIRRGLDTDRVVARFESERQALARMEHPGIARVLDAGADSAGRPFFVMEKVDGVPITDFCARESLNVEERLDLFRSVCRAVAHAHRKGIMHRDLKPSNVLVAIGESGPEPKIIDFGIAKATDESGTDQPALTQEGHMIGTPEYMSPEQAEGSANIDTRTDVYSLGVLLFEILTGELPYRFDTHRYREIQRVLRETEPKRPSESVEDGPGADRLRRRLQGDLDNIVLMALRKEPDRRYGSVEMLEEDIVRHTTGLPVAARKDTWTYRTGKFVRRNRVGVAAVSAVFGLLVVFSIVLVRKSADVTRERDRAVEAEKVAQAEAETARQVSDFLANIFEISDPGENRGNTVTAREILDSGAERIEDELADSPIVQGRLLATLGRVYHGLGLYDRADELLTSALAVQRDHLGPEDTEVGRTLDLYGVLRHDRGDYEGAIEASREALRILEQSLGDRNEDVATAMSNLAIYLRAVGELDEAESLLVMCCDIYEEIRGREDGDWAWCRMSLGHVLLTGGDSEAGLAAYGEALDIQRKLFDPPHPDLAATLNHLGGGNMRLDRLDTAVAWFEESLTMYRTLYPDGHTAIPMVLHNLGLAHVKQKDFEAAEPYLMESLEANRRDLGSDHPYIPQNLASLGSLYYGAERYAEAEPLFRESLALATRIWGDDHAGTAIHWRRLGLTLMRTDRTAEAAPMLRRALAIQEESLPADHPNLALIRADVAACEESLTTVQERDP